jgi:ArsR family transcriptional regulator, arsenate/arsenite/antimonite-responsive transcriptional repressor
MNDTDLVRVLKALADPIRFRMVQEIAAAGELSCAQIGEHFEVTQPTISHHLKILTDAEILVRRTEGEPSRHQL